MIDRALKRDPGKRAMSVYGDFDSLFKALLAQLEKGPYFLGASIHVYTDILASSFGCMGLLCVTRHRHIPQTLEVVA